MRRSTAFVSRPPRAGLTPLGLALLCLALLCLTQLSGVCGAPAAASAQALELSGYYENQLVPQQVDGQLVLQDWDRLRLDLFSAVDDRVVFAGDVVWRVLHGASRINALDLVPRAVAEAHAASLGLTEAQIRPSFDLTFGHEHFLDNAHVTLYLGALSLRLGKQQVPWGAGYTWNPTDVFHDKSYLDPTYEKEGVGAGTATWGFGAEGRITGLLAPGGDWARTTRALKVRDHVRGWDVGVVAAQLREEVTDYRTGRTRYPRRRLVGGEFSGQGLGLGLWGEGACNWLSRGSDFGQYLLGADHTTVGGTYFLAEYYHNGRGRGDAADYTLDDWMRLLGARGENLGREYVSLGVSRPAWELWTLSVYAIASLSDGSLVVFPWVEHSLGDNTELDLTAYAPLGGSLTEFGASGAGGLARIRVYF